MGNCLSFQLSCDQTMNSIFRFVCGKGYIRSLEENVKALKREMVDLKAKEVELQNKVKREEATGYRQRRRSVQVWLERVEKIDIKYNSLLSTSDDQLKKLCLCGLFSKNVCSSYKYGKKVSVLLEDVKKLKSEYNFGEVTEPTPRSGEQMLTQPTIGQEIMLEKAWKRLMEDKVGIMGVHGMGGVGKTTLLKKIHNKFIEKNNEFTEKARNLRVIWVVVSKGKDISKLQDDIAKKLDLPEEVWRNQTESDKAIEIHNCLKGKTFVLLLDDIWEAVDLEAIGVPIPTRENKCKVAFTTRFQEVCGNMGDTEPIQVKCLEEDEAWNLFEKNAGVEKLRRDPDIVKVAKRVAEKCGGLPLALNIIGKAMSSRTTVHEWKHALDLMTTSAADFSNFGEQNLTILKYSYDSLGDEHIKSCFLYCSLFPEDDFIAKERLIEYWRCEGFMRESQNIRRGINEGYEILGTLIRANLLMEAASTAYVVMHDMVREMALWIASDLGKQKYNFLVQAGVGLYKEPELKDWGDVKRLSLMRNKIEEITCNFKCSELTTLLLQENNLRNLSSEFIRSMQKLVVLNISENLNFNELPEQISELVSLQYLNLSFTSIEQLPVGFQELKKLIHLDLCCTSKLCSIRGISKLSSLRILELLKSNVHGDINLLEELRHLKDLQVLNLTISSKLGLEQTLGDEKLATCINGLHILGFQQEPLNISSLLSMENLRFLYLEKSHVSEFVTDTKSKKNTSLCFRNLLLVDIKECNSIKDLTWLLFAPNLIILEIEDSKEVEDIIKKEKATNLTGIMTTLFQKLEYLRLENLPKLESIYWSPLPFSVLLILRAIDCQKLRKFPLNASSAPRLLKIELSSREQLSDYKPDELSDTAWDEDDTMVPNNLEWEDEDTKNHFLPLIMKTAIGQTIQEMQ